MEISILCIQYTHSQATSLDTPVQQFVNVNSNFQFFFIKYTTIQRSLCSETSVCDKKEANANRKKFKRENLQYVVIVLIKYKIKNI